MNHFLPPEKRPHPRVLTPRPLAVFLLLLVLSPLSRTALAAEPARPDAILAGDYDWPIAHACWAVTELLKNERIAGMSVALVDGDRVVWAQGFGRSAPEATASDQTSYRVGGMSAIVTLLAAFRLADEGRLDLDAPVTDIVPLFKIRKRFPEARPITIRDLMTHRSGLPPEHLAGAAAKTPAPWATVVDLLVETYPTAPPGARSQESSLGITLLGLVIQNVAGVSFATYARDMVLGPLGMSRARFATGASPAIGDAVAYRKGKPLSPLGVRNVPGLGLHASVTDLAQVLRFLFGASDVTAALPLSADARDAFWRINNANVELDFGFPVGMGFALAGFGPLGLIGAGPVAVASTNDNHFPGVIAALPEHRLGVVVLSNSSQANQAVNQVAGELLANALDAKAGIRQPEIPEFPYADPPWSREQLATFAGPWATLMGLVQVEVKRNHLRVKALGRTFRLVPRTDGMLHLEYRLLGLFKINLKGLSALGFSLTTVDGRDYLVLHQGSTRVPFGVRGEPGPLPAAWEARLGRYRLENPGDEPVPFDRITLKRQAGLLTAKLRIRDMSGLVISLVLRPEGDGRAEIDGVGPGAGGVLEAIDGEQTVLTGSGWRFVRTGD